MSKSLIGWPQVAGLDKEKVNPPLPPLTWEIPLQLPHEYPTEAEAIIAAIKIGYNLGLRAARDEDLTELPMQKLPNPLLDSIKNRSTKTNANEY